MYNLNCINTPGRAFGSALSPDGLYAYFGIFSTIYKVDSSLNAAWSYTITTTDGLFTAAVTDPTGRNIYWGGTNYIVQVAPGEG